MDTPELVSARVALRLRHVGIALAARTRLALGYPAPMDSADRRVLERQILPALVSDPGVTRLAFAGCDWYTAHYERLLPGISVHTLDPDPRRRRYGAARHHVAPLQALSTLFPRGSLDAVVCNGVYGWGLDTRADCEQALRACAASLRPGGWLVFGWNHVPAHDPVPWSALRLDGFEPRAFAPLGVDRLEVAGSVDRHTYAFYCRLTGA